MEGKSEGQTKLERDDNGNSQSYIVTMICNNLIAKIRQIRILCLKKLVAKYILIFKN